ncbi:HAD-IIIA family hydrolase [Vagococcus elongatus]|uniref:D,D-heptose 1,7-bisphosphate phosphatase n=1 Tax=Vagococcus elongatus TaxID=180344 RepID=A0A430B4D2_9ENTE|nr:HAD-IIIA family hydrolase [Vagococcus elongatus]RSU15210.1 hypothetical protein CBF29_02430 [Vagococcus elongatus]
MIETILISRDGTLGEMFKTRTGKEFIYYPEALTAIPKLRKMALDIIVLTNQPKFYTPEINQSNFVNELYTIGINDVLICPHHKLERCRCHKPSTGLFEQARKKHHLMPEKCLMIGDSLETDIAFAHHAGIDSLLVTTGKSKDFTIEQLYSAQLQPTYIAENLMKAVEIIEELNHTNYPS